MHNNELYHYGVKGMKWGVRKAIKNERRKLRKEVYKDGKELGASSFSRNRRAHMLSTRKAIDATREEYDRQLAGKQTGKERANAYQNVIKNLNEATALSTAEILSNAESIEWNMAKIEKLRNKPENARRRKKIDRIANDTALMQMAMQDAMYQRQKYKDLTQQYVDRMSKDNAVVFRTKNKSLGGFDSYYVAGTDYTVKANDKKRQKDKRFSDPSNKKQYKEEVYKVTYVYY